MDKKVYSKVLLLLATKQRQFASFIIVDGYENIPGSHKRLPFVSVFDTETKKRVFHAFDSEYEIRGEDWLVALDTAVSEVKKGTFIAPNFSLPSWLCLRFGSRK